MQIREILQDIRTAKNSLNFIEPGVTIFGSARLNASNQYVKDAEKLCAALADMGYAVITGGGGGIMRGANKGAFNRAKAPSVGFNIKLPFEQKSNAFLTHDVHFKTFAPRKGALIANSEIFVIFPGGFGTMDELFEVLTLKQTGFKTAQIYLYDAKFYAPLVEFFKSSMLALGTIDEGDLAGFRLCSSVEEIIEYIKKEKI